MKTLNIGDKAKDCVTGFSGTITGKNILSNYTQYLLTGNADRDGKIEASWFEESRLNGEFHLSNKIGLNIGDKAKDCITGFSGIITSISEWITGCTQYELSSKAKKDGTYEHNTYDESRLDGTLSKPKVTGGPKPTAPSPR